ncbi:MAG: hypothetical protein H6605_08700 [Flavobacteriales bacterium]|nr:hypothetical protein [Flavobacteriales bacterium]
MQIVYKFRIHFDDHSDIVRFIDITSTSKFSDLHSIIQESIGFDGSKEYSFYMATDSWRSTYLICSTEKIQEDAPDPKEVSIHKNINNPDQHFIYIFDPDLEWTFNIELVKILKAEPHRNYPFIARKEGEAPKQYKLKGKLPGSSSSGEYDKMAEKLMADKLTEKLNKALQMDDEDEEDDEEEENEKEVIRKMTDKASAKSESDKKKPSSGSGTKVLDFEEEEFSVDDNDLDMLEGEEGDEMDDMDTDDDYDDYDEYGDDSADDY